MTASRTSLSIKNAKVAFLFYLVTGILNFVSRKIFIDHLGAEVIGLNATATNLLNFLNIAELGIGIAISYSLYAPLATKDNETISEIVSVQGYWYRKIGFIILAASLITMCFFPVFFAKMHLPLWYAYACFVALLASSLFSYFWNYRQIVLSADQKQYKITTILQGWKGIKIILQILAVIYLRNGFIYWVLLEFITSVLQTIALNYRINKEYPWLKASPSKGKILQKKYPEIITKTKQLFFHKIGSLVLTQTSPLILYAFTTLTLVAMYDNYLIVIIGITALLNSIFTSIGASVGNLVAQGDKKLIDNIFWELFSIRFLLVSTLCIGVYWMAQPFITLWVGSQYLLDNTSRSGPQSGSFHSVGILLRHPWNSYRCTIPHSTPVQCPVPNYLLVNMASVDSWFRSHSHLFCSRGNRTQLCKQRHAAIQQPDNTSYPVCKVVLSGKNNSSINLNVIYKIFIMRNYQYCSFKFTHCICQNFQTIHI